MTRYFNIDRYRKQKYGLISIYILLFDTNTTNYVILTPLGCCLPISQCRLIMVMSFNIKTINFKIIAEKLFPNTVGLFIIISEHENPLAITYKQCVSKVVVMLQCITQYIHIWIVLM